MKITKITVLLLPFFLWMGVVEGSEKIIRFTHELPVTHHNHQAAMKLAEEIQKGSHGALTLKVFPAAQLFSDKESIKAIKGGAVEMGMIPINYWVAYTPLADIFELPFLLSDFKTAYRAEDGVLGSAIQEDADKTGIKILGWWDYGPTHFWGKTKPLKKPEDFKGLRIRVYGGMVANTVKALGGAPVFMSGGEVYMALQRGTVDGLATGFTAFLERKFYEVNKYLLVAPQGYQTYTVMVSKSFWESLPPAQQKTIQDSVKLVADDVRKNVEKINEEAFQDLVKKGVQSYTASKEELKEFLKATQPVRDEFFSKHGDRAKSIVNEILK